MRFRRDGKKVHKWGNWCITHKGEIVCCRIPDDIVSTEENWNYFLEHGYNRDGWWNEAPWFEIMDLASTSEWAAFQALLSSYIEVFVEKSQQQMWRETLGKSLDSMIDFHNG